MFVMPGQTLRRRNVVIVVIRCLKCYYDEAYYYITIIISLRSCWCCICGSAPRQLAFIVHRIAIETDFIHLSEKLQIKQAFFFLFSRAIFGSTSVINYK